MNRTCVASMRNSLGAGIQLQLEDDVHNRESSCTNRSTAVAETSSSLLNTRVNRIQSEILSSVIVVDDIASFGTSPSDVWLRNNTDRWKLTTTTGSVRNRHTQLSDCLDVAESENITEAAAAAATSTEQQMASHLQNINLLDDNSVRNNQNDAVFIRELLNGAHGTIDHVDSNISFPMVQEQHPINLRACDVETRCTVDAIDGCNPPTCTSDTFTLTTSKSHCKILPCLTTTTLDCTYHDSLHYNVIDDDIHHRNSTTTRNDNDDDDSDCWTEEECGTATSSDFMVLPTLQHRTTQNAIYNNIRNGILHHRQPRPQPPQTQSQHCNNISSESNRNDIASSIEYDDSDDENHHSSTHSSSTGCTVNLWIHSCQSSVTWYEGSNIDEIDITNLSSTDSSYDHTANSSDDDEYDDDDDAVVSLSSG